MDADGYHYPQVWRLAPGKSVGAGAVRRDRLSGCPPCP